MAAQSTLRGDDSGQGSGRGPSSRGKWRFYATSLTIRNIVILGVVVIGLAFLGASHLANRSSYRIARASDDGKVFLPIAMARLVGRPSVTPFVTLTSSPGPSSTPTQTRPTSTAGPSSTPTQTLTPSVTRTSTPILSKTPTPTASSTRTLSPTRTPTPTLNPVQQRFGVNYLTAYGSLTEYPLQSLPFGWYSDYSFRMWPQESQGREYVQMIPVDSRWYSLDWDYVRATAQNNPGALWLIGNEPECTYQANLTPDVYAQRYYKAYTEIKSADPMARVAVGGVVQPTPLRLQWLDMVRGRYQSRYQTPIPVDVWNIHNMILMEREGGYGAGIPVGIDAELGKYYPWQENTNMDYFKAHIVAMRQWMQERGYRDKPLIISEYGVLYPCSYWDPIAPPSCVDRINTFMDATFEYMLTATDDTTGYPADGNRLVQRWSWFSLNCPTYEQEPGVGFEGNLCDPYSSPKQLTLYGEHFQSTVNRLIGLGGAAKEP